MLSKRNRLSRSLSQGEVATLMMPPPVDSWQKKRRPATNSRINANPVNKPVNVLHLQQPTMINKWNHWAVAVHEPAQKHGKSACIWTLTDDEDEKDKKDYHHHRQVNVVDESFGAFYQACALCKKKLPLTKNIFMYGYLQAFCSVECRDAKIAVDDRFKTPSPRRSTALTSSKPGNNSASRAAANGYGSKGKRTIIARFE